jgi:outer membrane protein TolC
VRAARRRVEAADFRVSEAIASRLPTFSLSASVGFSSGEFTSLFENLVYSLIGGMTAPLFDGGAGKGRVNAAEAGTYAALAEYGQTMLVAIKEVEDALLQEQQQRDYIAALEEQLQAAEDNLESTRARYRQGDASTNFLDVLNPRQVIEDIQRNLIAARREQLSHRVQLCRAVGGSWTSDIVRERELLLESSEQSNE